MFVHYLDCSTNTIKTEKLEDFKNGPIKGTYYINGELFSLPSLIWRTRSYSKILHSISENANNKKEGDFSGLIPYFDFKRYMIDGRFVCVENSKIMSENELSAYLAFMTGEDGLRVEAPALESFLQNEIGLDVSIEKGFKLYETD